MQVTRGIKALAIGVEVIDLIGIPVRARIHANGTRIGQWVVARRLQRLPGAFQQDALLRIGDLGLAGGIAKKFCIKLINIGNDGIGFDVVRMVDQFRGDTGAQQFFRAKKGDRIHAITQILPEFRDVVGAWKATGHADNGDPVWRAIGSTVHRSAAGGTLLTDVGGVRPLLPLA